MLKIDEKKIKELEASLGNPETLLVIAAEKNSDKDFLFHVATYKTEVLANGIVEAMKANPSVAELFLHCVAQYMSDADGIGIEVIDLSNHGNKKPSNGSGIVN
jgi:catechol-2,3-dioxygenase